MRFNYNITLHLLAVTFTALLTLQELRGNF